MVAIKLAFKLLWRDWRAGELRLLFVSLVIAVGSVTTVTLFVDRLEQALLSESATFLAADQVISSSEVIDPAIVEELAQIHCNKKDSEDISRVRIIGMSRLFFN